MPENMNRIDAMNQCLADVLDAAEFLRSWAMSSPPFHLLDLWSVPETTSLVTRPTIFLAAP
jgi:hypothetical protein